MANWKQVQGRVTGGQAVHWKMPNVGCLKANSDAVVRGDKMGLCMVFRDDCGNGFLSIVKERSSGCLSMSAVEL